MERKISTKIQGYRTVDGAGVSLVRVLGNHTTEEFDPILMLDSFDSTNPSDYIAGFPMHPHRGIETISYIAKGKMVHKDTLGNEEAVGDGEVQWMNAGSGILHEEQVPAADRLLGVQLWLNLPSDQKMSKPTYRSIKKDEIPEVQIEGGKIRILAGSYKDVQGYQSQHLPLDYYAIELTKDARLKIDSRENDSVMLFSLLGSMKVGDEIIPEKTAVKLLPGTYVNIQALEDDTQVLYMSSKALKEPVAWAGPIVMNTHQELEEAFDELNAGTFIKDRTEIQS